jgi:hypothetical protein
MQTWIKGFGYFWFTFPYQPAADLDVELAAASTGCQKKEHHEESSGS